MNQLGLICLTLLLSLFSQAVLAKGDCLNIHVINSTPIGYINESGEMTGTQPSYLEAIAKESGLCFDLIMLPYPRIWKSIELGQHDGGIIFRSQSRSHLVEYVAKIRSINIAVIPLSGNTISHYDDLTKLTIGKLRGSHLSPKFNDDPRMKVVEIKSYDQMIKMLKAGRINAVAGGAHMLTYQLEVQGMMGKVDLTQSYVLGQKEQWMQLSKKSPHLDKIPQMKQAIESLRQQGILDDIMNDFFGSSWQLVDLKPLQSIAE
ncbi:substrate-binding periplasmic protein [Shewanella maritima]|uniref:substrate-binding periplasmic protein n=1 Tax=Shewanella maritima TaxID=2520507 RepID=UPI00373649AF